MTTLNQRAAAALATLEQQGRIKSALIAGMVMADYGRGIRYLWSDEQHHNGCAVGGRTWMRSPCGEHDAIDLSDPLTVQALLLMVREASGDEGAFVESALDGWSITYWALRHGEKCHNRLSAPTEAEALVYALEALAAETA